MRSRASITFAVGVVAFVLDISRAAQASTRCQLRGSSTIVQTSRADVIGARPSARGRPAAAFGESADERTLAATG